jgi:hypothetical protein
MMVVVKTLLEPCERIESTNNNVVNGTLKIEVLVLCTKERVIESNRRNRIDCLSVSLVHWINQMHQIRPRVQPFI